MLASSSLDAPFRNPFRKSDAVLFMAVAVFIWCWTLIYCVFVYQPQYSANAVVVIKDSALTTRYIEPDRYYVASTTSSNAANPVLNTMGLLKSSAIMDALWVYFSQNHPKALKKKDISTKADWEEFYGNGKHLIKSKNQPGTDLISIEFVWDDPAIAKEGLDVAVDAFQKASLELNQAEQRNRSAFLEKEIAEVAKQLDDVRTQKSLFKTRTKTVNISQEGDELARNRITLANELNQAEAKKRGKLAEVQRYQQMLGMSTEEAVSATAVGLNATLSKLMDKRYELDQQYANLRTTLTEKNPRVKEVKAQLDQVESDIRKEQARTLGGKHLDGQAIADSTRGAMVADMVSAHSEAIRLDNEINVLRQRLNEVDSLIEQVPEVEAELATISQKEASLSQALDTLRQKSMEAQLKETQTLSNVFVVDPPRLPNKDKFPNQVHILLGGFILGVLGGLASVLLKAQVRQYLPGQTQYLPHGTLQEQLADLEEQWEEDEDNRIPEEAFTEEAIKELDNNRDPMEIEPMEEATKEPSPAVMHSAPFMSAPVPKPDVAPINQEPLKQVPLKQEPKLQEPLIREADLRPSVVKEAAIEAAPQPATPKAPVSGANHLKLVSKHPQLKAPEPKPPYIKTQIGLNQSQELILPDLRPEALKRDSRPIGLAFIKSDQRSPVHNEAFVPLEPVAKQTPRYSEVVAAENVETLNSLVGDLQKNLPEMDNPAATTLEVPSEAQNESISLEQMAFVSKVDSGRRAKRGPNLSLFSPRASQQKAHKEEAGSLLKDILGL